MTDADSRSSPRIAGVDIARAVALLGILFVNMRLFLGPLGAVIEPEVAIPGLARTAADRFAWSAVEILCTYKFISLFSLLFGFGIAVQSARAVAAGRSRWSVGLPRLAVLLAIGLAHGFLVWYGDVLAMYACLGVVVLMASRASARRVLLLAATVASIGLLLMLAGLVLRIVAESFPEPADPAWMAGEVESAAAAEASHATALRGWSAIEAAGFDPSNPVFVEAEIAAIREGPYADALVFRSFSYASGLAIALFSYAWHALAMMLFGVWAFASGLFEAAASARRRRLAAWAIPTGLLLGIGAVLPGWLLGQGTIASDALHAILLELGAFVLPVGYAAAFVEWGPRLPALLATALARTGRMSLTVYLSESLLATAIASWWGLGWFATMGYARLALLAIGLWTALVLAANGWLARFRTGPMEWLWRRLARAGSAR